LVTALILIRFSHRKS